MSAQTYSQVDSVVLVELEALHSYHMSNFDLML
jgi:hypothetical protein